MPAMKTDSLRVQRSSFNLNSTPGRRQLAFKVEVETTAPDKRLLNKTTTQHQTFEIIMKKIDSDLFDPAVEPIEEKLHRTARGVITMIPVVNGIANEIFNSILESPLTKRRTQWMHSVTQALNELIESKKTTLESLQENDEFIDVLVQATLIAQKTSQEGKITALRNAVTNSSSAEVREIKKSAHFLRLLDSFDEWHLKILDFYKDANKYVDFYSPDNHKLSALSLVKKAFPELDSEEAYTESLWFDLKHTGLLIPSTPGELRVQPQAGDRRGKYACMVTPLALEFLNFISDDNTLSN